MTTVKRKSKQLGQILIELGYITPEQLETAGARWLELYRETDAAQLLPGAAESLRRLADAGFVLGLVTAGDEDVVVGRPHRCEAHAGGVPRTAGHCDRALCASS